VIGYHCTDKKTAVKLARNVSDITPRTPHNWHNDLGDGFYLYTDPVKDIGFNSAEDNSRQYYDSLGRLNAQVLRVFLKNEFSELDFNDEETHIRFQKIRRFILKQAISRARSRNLRLSATQIRNNADGVVLEFAIKRKIIPDADVVVKDTFTEFLDPLYEEKLKEGASYTNSRGNEIKKLKQKSNFENGREVCVRNVDIILKCEVV
jgi:hypothetical protein